MSQAHLPIGPQTMKCMFIDRSSGRSWASCYTREHFLCIPCITVRPCFLAKSRGRSMTSSNGASRPKDPLQPPRDPNLKDQHGPSMSLGSRARESPCLPLPLPGHRENLGRTEVKLYTAWDGRLDSEITCKLSCRKIKCWCFLNGWLFGLRLVPTTGLPQQNATD